MIRKYINKLADENDQTLDKLINKRYCDIINIIICYVIFFISFPMIKFTPGFVDRVGNKCRINIFIHTMH